MISLLFQCQYHPLYYLIVDMILRGSTCGLRRTIPLIFLPGLPSPGFLAGEVMACQHSVRNFLDAGNWLSSRDELHDVRKGGRVCRLGIGAVAVTWCVG